MYVYTLRSCKQKSDSGEKIAQLRKQQHTAQRLWLVVKICLKLTYPFHLGSAGGSLIGLGAIWMEIFSFLSVSYFLDWCVVKRHMTMQGSGSVELSFS